MALIPYSMPVRELLWRGPTGYRSADIRLRLQYTGEDRSIHDSAWHWRLDSSAVAPQSLVATSFILFDTTALPREWKLSATDTASLPVASLPLDPPTGRGSVELSDLVIGDSIDGAAWHNGQDIVYVTGATYHVRSRPLHIYYQLRSALPRAHVSTIISVSPASRRGESREIRLLTTDHLNSGITPVRRIIGLSRMKPGRYTLRIEIRESDANLCTRQQVIDLR